MKRSRGLRATLSVYDDYCFLGEEELNSLEVENDFNEEARRGIENSSGTSSQSREVYCD